jgi:hypothetical protein
VTSSGAKLLEHTAAIRCISPDTIQAKALMIPRRSSHGQFLLFVSCLVGVLLVLFRNSFDSRLALFSNDGPLGAVNERAVALPTAFQGVWYDLTSVGNNGGSLAPTLSNTLRWALGPLNYSKYYVPLILFFLGGCAWVFFRCLGFSFLPCLLGALAATLNSDFFSTACWGVGPQTVCFGFIYLALAALAISPARWSWLKFVLAGMAVGMGVMEGFDIGAILSLYVAAFVLFQAWVSEETPAKRVGLGITRLALVAGFALFIAAHAVSTLVSTQIQGVAGMQQETETKEQHWDWATQWSLPKIETLRVLIPGLFGYRMDTPEGGDYWGAVGRDAQWEKYLASGAQGQAPRGFSRHSGTGPYAGVLVVLVALWAAAQSLRKKDNPFTLTERKLIWFWCAVILVSLLFAFGRHAPFYRLIYSLPYFSAIRNPVKFVHPVNLALVILFAYGLQGLVRRYLEKTAARTQPIKAPLQSWWASAPAFDKKWSICCIAALGFSLIGWMLYATSRPALESYLQKTGYSPDHVKMLLSFSFREIGLFVLLLAIAITLLTLILSGLFRGPRAKLAGVLLGVLLLADLCRANAPWIVYYDYKEKYASNPILEILRDKPWEHRVQMLPGQLLQVQATALQQKLGPQVQPYFQEFGLLQQIYGIDWLQLLFQYYDIQSLDIVQMPRVPADIAAFQGAMGPSPLRLLQLTNSRLLFGFGGPAVELLNDQIDPAQRRFRLHTGFRFAPNVPNPTKAEHFSAVIDPNGPLALIEFIGALPRARLYSQWQINTNDSVMLQRLVDAAFDPAQVVFVSNQIPSPSATATNQPAGVVEYKSYAPKRIELAATSSTPAVLLLNDKFDPNWKVWVDGRPETVLRCNFLMRGVFVQAGTHTIEFRFEPPGASFYVSLAAIVLGLALCGFLAASKPSGEDANPNVPAKPAPKEPKATKAKA